MKRLISLLTVVLALSLLAAGCGGSARPVEVPVDEEEVVAVEEEDVAVEEVSVPLLLSTELDEENEPVDVVDSFPSSMERICGSFQLRSDVDVSIEELEIEILAADDDWEWEIGEPALEWLSASPSGRIGFCFDAPDLPPGEYTLEVHDDDGLLVSDGDFEWLE